MFVFITPSPVEGRGIVIERFLCLFVYLFLYQQHCEKTAGPICMKFSGKVWSDHAEPLFIVGDLNVHLERSSDPSATLLVDLLADYGLTCRVNEPTHDLGGLLDIVASRDDVQLPSVVIIDAGLSDHRLLRWRSQ